MDLPCASIIQGVQYIKHVFGIEGLIVTLNFQEVHEQVAKMGEGMLSRAQQLRQAKEKALAVLGENADNLAALREKVLSVARHHDPSVRCALPTEQPLNAHFPLPSLASDLTILAADGSQIGFDRHAEVAYCLINVGAILLNSSQPETPQTVVHSHLLYEDALYTPTGVMSDAALALLRDINERTLLADLAGQLSPPLITLADGPMELWGGRADEIIGEVEFQQRLDEYLNVLERLCAQGVATAGYVDRPAAGLVVRLLEIAMLPEAQMAEVKQYHPLRGVTDRALYEQLLAPGERSALFALQSQSAPNYTGELALHFFYLNVGRQDYPYIARVEIPAWVAHNSTMLDHLHAALVGQCRVMGMRPYPYVLHRAHEMARVSQQEKEQVTQMILAERMRRLGVPSEKSSKQFAKDLPGRRRW